MGSDILLKPACELSYAIARAGVESEPPIPPPDGMRSFLYVSELSSRAISVAQQVIDEDPVFRRRVADGTTDNEVGRAGYLWLHRPSGWATELEQLGGNGSIVPQPAPDEPDPLPDQADVPDPLPSLADVPDLADVLPVAVASHDPEAGSGHNPGGNTGEIVRARPPSLLDESMSESKPGDAIEDELASLRGLVDRLSHERKAVSNSFQRVEQDLQRAGQQPSVFDSDLYTLQSELEMTRTELETARHERDAAVSQQSTALTRQLELERELARQRDLRAEIEQEHAEMDAAAVQVREALARTETSLTSVEEQRDDLRAQIDALKLDNDDLTSQLNRVAEEKTAQTRALEAEYKALQAETETLSADKDTLADRLATVEADLAETVNRLAQVDIQAEEHRSLAEELAGEKIDLASRLADTESMLEHTRSTLSGVRAEHETTSSELVNVRSHRDSLSGQVDDLHMNLTEALNDLAAERSKSDGDRASLKEMKNERDSLRVRIGTLEQHEEDLEAKLATVTTDRDTYLSRIDQMKGELVERDTSYSEVMAENERLLNELTSTRETRDQLSTVRNGLQADLDDATTRAADLEEARSMLTGEVERLTEENKAINAKLVESDRLRVDQAESKQQAISELVQQLSMAEVDKNRLQSELQTNKDRLVEAMEAFEQANQQVADQAYLRSEGDAPPPSVEELSASGLSGGTDTFGSTANGRVDRPFPAPRPDPRRLGEDTGEIAKPAAAAGLSPSGPPSAPTPVVSGPPVSDAPTAARIFSDADGQPEPNELSIFAQASETSPPAASTSAATPAPAVGSTPAVNPTPVVEPTPDAESTLATDQPEAEIDRRDTVDIPSASRSRWGVTSVRTKTPKTPRPSSGSLSNGTAAGGATARPPSARPGKAGSGSEPDLESTGDGDVDLDEISDLITRTMTNFDPGSLPSPENPEAEALRRDTGDPKSRSRRTSKRLFPVRSDDDYEPGKGHDATDPGGVRAAGVAPPSVFGGGGEETMVSAAPVGRPMDLVPMVEPDKNANHTKGAAGRRQIDVPEELVDDEVEFARHVVSSPDVVLLVDGDSVAKMGWPSLPVPQQRDALVSYLADLSATSGAAPDVVFDGRIGEEESLPASRAVRIRLSTPPTEPTAALDELVDAYPEQWPIAVVTDDEELVRSAHERGAAVLNNGQLLDLFISS